MTQSRQGRITVSSCLFRHPCKCPTSITIDINYLLIFCYSRWQYRLRADVYATNKHDLVDQTIKSLSSKESDRLEAQGDKAMGVEAYNAESNY